MATTLKAAQKDLSTSDIAPSRRHSVAVEPVYRYSVVLTASESLAAAIAVVMEG